MRHQIFPVAELQEAGGSVLGEQHPESEIAPLLGFPLSAPPATMGVTCELGGWGTVK
jgi:hypothetical protein